MRLSHESIFYLFFSTANIEKWFVGGGKESHSAINSRILNFDGIFFRKKPNLSPFFVPIQFFSCERFSLFLKKSNEQATFILQQIFQPLKIFRIRKSEKLAADRFFR